MKKPRKKYPDVWCYTDMNFRRTISRGIGEARISLWDYKGHILLDVTPIKETELATLAKHAGVEIGDTAWLDGEKIDDLIALLRDAKKVWLAHHRRMTAVEACKDCAKVFGGMCDRHAKRKRR